MSAYPDRFTAYLDACVLAGALRRNMLLSLAEAGLFRPRWSARVLDETQSAIARITNGATDGQRQREAIDRAFPEALVSGYEPLEPGLVLPDPDDRHVLAAAIATSASVIVTDNLRDFPADALAGHGLSAVSADAFLADTIALDTSVAMSALRRMRVRFGNPALDVETLVRKSEGQGLLQVATLMDGHRPML